MVPISSNESARLKLEKVFVYGTLKESYGLHSAILGYACLGVTSVKGYLFHLGGCPAYIPCEEGVPVYGEVYRCDRPLLNKLDMIEGVDGPGGYLRAAIRTPGIGPCWTYIYPETRLTGNSANWNVIPSGRWDGPKTHAVPFMRFLNDNPLLRYPAKPKAIYDPLVGEWVINLRPPLVGMPYNSGVIVRPPQSDFNGVPFANSRPAVVEMPEYPEERDEALDGSVNLEWA